MRRLTFLTAAALAIGGITFVPSTFGQDTPQAQPGQTPAERSDDQMDRAADRTGDVIRHGVEGDALAPDAEGIRDTLAQITEAAVTKDGLDDIVERFVDADRNRLGETDHDANLETLNGIIEQFQQNWQARYNTEFDIDDEGKVFDQSFVLIRQGEFGEGGARVAGERQPGAVPPGERPETTPPAPGETPTAPPDATADRDRVRDTGQVTDRDRLAGGDTNREPGRDMAVIMITPQHGQPGVRAEMIKEFPDSWKLDLPDNVSADQLRTNLESALTQLNQQKDQWPADVTEAHRQVSHAILSAVVGEEGRIGQGLEGHRPMDRDMPGHQPGQQQPGQTPGQDMPR